MTLESGNVPLNTPYTAFPNFHIEAAVLSMVTALPTLKTTLFFASGLLSIVSLVVIFKLARVLLDTRSSLLATLFASVTTWLVQSRVEMLPYLTGLSLFPFMLYFTITRDRLRFRGLVFFILFSSLVLTHTLSSFVTLFCMGAFLFGWRLVRPLRQGQLHTLLYSLIFLISYWLFVSTFSLFAIRNIVETLTHPTALGFPLHFLSWGESDLSWLGTYIIYWFAILGCLAYLSRKRRTAQRLGLVISVLGLFGISYGFMVVLSSWAVVPDRWFPFGLTLAVIPASYAIISLAKQSEKRSKALFICILVFVLVFFSITSSFANDDFPILTRAVTVNSLTSAELQSATLLNAIHEGPITTDGYYAQDLFNQTLNHGHLGENDLTILQTGMLEGSSPVEGLVIIRASGFLFPVTIETGGTYASGVYSPYFYVSKTYDHSFVQQMVSRGNVVYNSQSVIAIVILQ
jgi:hypothetical protein